MTIVAADCRLTAADGVSLAARFVEPAHAPPRLAVVIHPATAVPRQYYRAFADHLAGRGIAVLTYDYRGIGGSRAGRDRDNRFRFSDWGRFDQPAAVRWLAENRPDLPIAAVCHSAGGQMLGLSEAGPQLHAALLIASQHGHPSHWPWLQGLGLRLLWHVGIPVFVDLFDHFPGALIGGQDLPKGIAQDWARFGRSRHFLVDGKGQAWRPYNDRLTLPIKLMTFSDDPYAPRRAGEALLREFYPRARVEHAHYTPTQLGCARIGHFGYFRAKPDPALWDNAAYWLFTASGV